MNPILLVGALGLGALLLLAKKTPAAGTQPSAGPAPDPSEGLPGVPPPPTPTYNTGVDVGTIMTGIPTVLPTEEQRTKFQTVMSNLGVDPTGWIRTVPPLWAKDEALALADELDKVPNMNPAFPAAIREIAMAAAKLPDNPTLAPVIGPGGKSLGVPIPLGQSSLSDVELGAWSDWWQGFFQKWSQNWWRRGS